MAEIVLKPAEYKLRKMTPEITMVVRIVETKEFVVRKWIAARLICLAARVLGCLWEIETEEQDDISGRPE